MSLSTILSIGIRFHGTGQPVIGSWCPLDNQIWEMRMLQAAAWPRALALWIYSAFAFNLLRRHSLRTFH